MPCYRCGARQVDPARGHSPWRRGVRADEQVLVCPACQAAADWTADLDKCRQCGSVHLVRRLGEVECRDCGTTGPPAPEGGPREPSVGVRAPGLSEEVALALDRVLRRGAASR
jgi:ribosomal protein L40E